MRKLVQITILCVAVLLFVFLAPILHYEKRFQEWRTDKPFDVEVTECSLAYSAFQVGLNHRYHYVSLANGSNIINWDWGWRLDASTTIPTKPVPHGVVNGTGTIKYIELEGGFYGIVSDDDYHYDPTGSLPQEFAVDGLRVSFSLRILENVGSYQMWGYIVEVISMEKSPQ